MHLIVKLFTVADNLKTLTSNLSKRGPHRVMVGDLAFTGLPGKVYTPAEGNGIPGIAFAHDWRTPIEEYHATLRHLASWGIAVAAPDTENGIVANHRGLANDLETALQILAGVRLGEGKVVVHPKKLGVAGHDLISGVGCVFPATTAPSSSAAATNVSAPGLVLAPGEDQWLDRGNPARLAVQWKGDVVYREVDKADQGSFSETTLLRRLAGFSSSKVKYQEVARAALTGFLLATVGDDKKYSDFADPTATIKGTTNRDMEWLIKELPENPEHSLIPGK